MLMNTYTQPQGGDVGKRLKRILMSACAVVVAASPVIASAASDTKSTTINATLSAVISMTTSTTVTVNITPTSGGAMSSNSDTVTVSTNAALGYTLQLSNGDTTLNLVNGGNTIGAHAGTQGSPTTLANNSWGYRVDSVGGFGAGPTSSESNVASSTYTWAGTPSSASPNTIRNQSSNVTNQTTTVWYGVMVDTSKPTGTYTDTVTYTATTN